MNCVKLTKIGKDVNIQIAKRKIKITAKHMKR